MTTRRCSSSASGLTATCKTHVKDTLRREPRPVVCVWRCPCVVLWLGDGVCVCSASRFVQREHKESTIGGVYGQKDEEGPERPERAEGTGGNWREGTERERERERSSGGRSGVGRGVVGCGVVEYGSANVVGVLLFSQSNQHTHTTPRTRIHIHILTLIFQHPHLQRYTRAHTHTHTTCAGMRPSVWP